MEPAPQPDAFAGTPQHVHAGEWYAFEIHAKEFRSAARLAATLGWWLHCWTWVGGEDAPDEPVIVDLRPGIAGDAQEPA